jgi:hypothetical protein
MNKVSLKRREITFFASGVQHVSFNHFAWGNEEFCLVVFEALAELVLWIFTTYFSLFSEKQFSKSICQRSDELQTIKILNRNETTANCQSANCHHVFSSKTM